MFQLVAVIIAAIAAGTSVYAVWNSHHKDSASQLQDVIRAAISASLLDIREDVHSLQADFSRLDERGSAKLVEVLDRLGRMETKIEVFWRAVAFDATQVLHKPHSGHERMDELLDSYAAGTIDLSDMEEFMGKLRLIRDYRHGIRVPPEDAALVPPDAGERLSAALLLRIIEAGMAKPASGSLER